LANITTKALTITGAAAADKVYNRDATATVSGGALSGAISGDTVSFSLGSASFADWNVGANKLVTVSGSALGGLSNANYTLTEPTGLYASITPYTLTVSGMTAGNKVYDQTATATMAGGTLNSFSGDTVSIDSSTANFANKNVGNGKAVTVTNVALSGAAATNYTVSLPTGVTANITPLALTVSGLSVCR